MRNPTVLTNKNQKSNKTTLCSKSEVALVDFLHRNSTNEERDPQKKTPTMTKPNARPSSIYGIKSRPCLATLLQWVI